MKSESGMRFEFGRNWKSFLPQIDESRIQDACQATQTALKLQTLQGRSFLDIGSGSGLFSLVAMRLGADRVHSFDYDPLSVDCTLELKRLHFPGDPRWSIERGSILDPAYVRGLGPFDVVYSWGVLHHTGNLWQAVDHAALLVKAGGLFYLSIYNHQEHWSQFWSAVKHLYNRLPRIARWPVNVGFFCYFRTAAFAADILRRRSPFRRRNRGMSMYVDVVDWIGGLPFETAKPEAVLDFCRDRGFILEGLTTCGGRHGCNEFVFCKDSQSRFPDASAAAQSSPRALHSEATTGA